MAPKLKSRIRHAHDLGDYAEADRLRGVAVYPGDIIFGDSEAVIVIPKEYVEEICDKAIAMEEQEEFLKTEIEAGRATLGVYPPIEETLARYAEWREARSVKS